MVVFSEGDLNSMRTNDPRGPVFKEKRKSVISRKLNDKIERKCIEKKREIENMTKYGHKMKDPQHSYLSNF